VRGVVLVSVKPTSLEAYIILKHTPILGKRQEQVLQAISEYPNRTDKEISMMTGLPINVITPRRGELVKKGVVKQNGTRKCRITGRKAMIWRADER